MRLQPGRRFRRSGEGDDILAGQMVEEIAERTGDELDGPLRQHVGVEQDAKRRFGKIGRGTRGFHDRRDAGQERRSEFFQHAPHGEIERIDMDGNPL